MTDLEHELSIYYSYLLRREKSNLFAGENICAFKKKSVLYTPFYTYICMRCRGT